MDVAKASHAIQESLKLAGGAAAAAVKQVLPSTGKASSSSEVPADPQAAAPGSSISPKMAATREYESATIAVDIPHSPYNGSRATCKFIGWGGGPMPPHVWLLMTRTLSSQGLWC